MSRVSWRVIKEVQEVSRPTRSFLDIFTSWPGGGACAALGCWMRGGLEMEDAQANSSVYIGLILGRNSARDDGHGFPFSLRNLCRYLCRFIRKLCQGDYMRTIRRVIAPAKFQSSECIPSQYRQRMSESLHVTTSLPS